MAKNKLISPSAHGINFINFLDILVFADISYAPKLIPDKFLPHIVIIKFHLLYKFTLIFMPIFIFCAIIEDNFCIEDNRKETESQKLAFLHYSYHICLFFLHIMNNTAEFLTWKHIIDITCFAKSK